MSAAVHTLPVYEGMTAREAWQHITDAGVGEQVPEFVREAALGRRAGWVNLLVEHDQVVGIDVAGRKVLIGDDDFDEHMDEAYAPDA